MKKKNYIMSVPDDFLVEFCHALKLGFKVKVTGLGIFSVNSFKARKGVDLDGEVVDRPGFNKLKFIATLSIKEFIQKIK